MRKFDGPYSFPIIGTLYMVNIFDISKFTTQSMELAQYYCQKGCGTIGLWLGPVPLIAVINPQHAKEILESNEVITKAEEYDILFPWLGTGLLTSTGKKFYNKYLKRLVEFLEKLKFEFPTNFFVNFFILTFRKMFYLKL